MKYRYLKYGIGSVIFLFMIFGAFLLIQPVYTRVNSRLQDLKSYALSVLEEKTGLSISYESLSPSILAGIRLSGIEVSVSADGLKIGEVDSVFISYNLKKLIEKDFLGAIRSISINGLHVQWNENLTAMVMGIVTAGKDNVAEPEASPSEESGASSDGEKNVKEILSGITGFNLPFPVTLRQAVIGYSAGSMDVELQLNTMKVEAGDKENTTLSLDVSGNIALSARMPKIEVPALEGLFSEYLTMSTSFSTQVVITPELEGTFAKLKLSNSNGNSFSFNGCDFSANLNGDRVSCSLFSYGNPFGITLSYNFSSNSASVYFNAENFSPFTFITLKNSTALLEKLDGIRLSGIYGVDFKGSQNDITYNMVGSVMVPAGLLPEYPFPDGVTVSADLEGDFGSVNINTLHVVSESMDVSYFGSFDISRLRPQGEMFVEKFTLPSGENAQCEFYISQQDDGIHVAAPQVFLGDYGLTGLEATVAPGTVSTDFSLKVYDYVKENDPSSIIVDGSLLMDDGYFIQVGVSLEDIYCSGIIKILERVLPQDMKLPDSVTSLLSEYRFSMDVYATTDMSAFTYNLSECTIENIQKENMRLTVSLDGNENSLHVSSLDISAFGQSFSGEIFADSNEDYSEFMFTSDFRLNTLPYSVSGTYSKNSFMTLTGNYDLGFNMEFSPDGMLSGSLAFDTLPVMFSDYLFSFSLDTDFVFLSMEDWHLNVKQFSGAENSGKLKIEPVVEIGCYADRYGIILDSVAYGDTVSALTGNGSISYDFSDGILNSGAVLLSMKNGDTQEALNIDLSGMNSDGLSFTDSRFLSGFMVSGTVDVTDFPLSKVMSDQQMENTVTVALSVLGPLDNPLVTMDVPQVSVKFGESALNADTHLELEDKIVSLTSMNGKFGPVEISDSQGQFSMTDMEGAFSFNVSAQINDAFSMFTPVEVYAKAVKKDETMQYEVEAELVRIENSIIEPIENYMVSLVASKDGIDFTAGESGLITGSMNNGMVSMDVKGDFPLKFRLEEGSMKDGAMNLPLKDIKIDLMDFARFLPAEYATLNSGIVTGDLLISGQLNDPEINGEIKIGNVNVNVDYALKSPVIIDQLVIKFNQHSISIDQGRINSGTGEAAVSLAMELDNMSVQNIEAGLKIPLDRRFPLEMVLPFAEVKAGIYGDIQLEITKDSVAVTGSIGTEDTELALTDLASLASSDDEKEQIPMEVFVDMDVSVGQKSQFYYPGKNNPVLRGLIGSSSPIHVTMNTATGAFNLKGSVSTKGGEVLYLGRNFYLREGSVSFNESETKFDPIISMQAEMREKDDDGNTIKVILGATNQKLSAFSPKLSSEPSRSEEEIEKLLGTAILAGTGTSTTEILGQVAAGGIDYLLQNSLFRQVENRLRDLFNFDIFSFRTPFFQQALLKVFSSDTSMMNPSNFLDNTTVYIGKYIGTDIYLDAMIRLVYTEGSGSDGSEGRLVIQPEIGLELPSPFATIRWSIAPDVLSAKKLWVPYTSISLSWKFTF